MPRTLVALGGNALSRPGGPGSWAEAVAQFDAAAPALVELLQAGHELLVSHGNGPQVGRLLLQGELAQREVPVLPLDVLVAESQAQIGYLVQRGLSAALARTKLPKIPVPVLTRVAVDPADPAFRHPTKPVGRVYDENESRLLRKQRGWTMERDPSRGGWRRVVPSPKPIDWLDEEPVRALLAASNHPFIPIVGGGGGVPVVVRANGAFDGVEAVVDKDLTSSLIAGRLGAELLVIATDVPAVAVGFGKRWERWLGRVTPGELKGYLDAGEFAEGSMRPKVEAALGFLAAGGTTAIISDIPSLRRAVQGDAGTRVESDGPGPRS